MAAKNLYCCRHVRIQKHQETFRSPACVSEYFHLDKLGMTSLMPTRRECSVLFYSSMELLINQKQHSSPCQCFKIPSLANPPLDLYRTTYIQTMTHLTK